jgi:hypothetical protein
MDLGRGTPPVLSRRACSLQHGLHLFQRYWAGVEKRRRELKRTPTVRFASNKSLRNECHAHVTPLKRHGAGVTSRGGAHRTLGHGGVQAPPPRRRLRRGVVQLERGGRELAVRHAERSLRRQQRAVAGHQLLRRLLQLERQPVPVRRGGHLWGCSRYESATELPVLMRRIQCPKMRHQLTSSTTKHDCQNVSYAGE